MSNRKQSGASWLKLSAVSLVLSTQVYAGESITGVAFRDYNANGSQDLLEPGIGGLQISATDELGNTETTPTASDGSYSIATLAGTKARVEFMLPADGSLNFLKPASGASSVQFVDISTSDATNISAGFNNPAQYCNANPQLATPCYVHGPSEGNTLDALVGFDYSASGANGDNDQSVSHYATSDTIGTTYGLAYQRSSKTLYASAFMKRHSGFGPGGTGAIYSVDPSGTNPPSIFVDLNEEFGADTAGVDPHAFGITETCTGQFEAGETNGNCWFHDSDTWAEVGRSSLGDLEISDDESELYVINLKDKSLYTIPTTAPAGQVAQYQVPLSASDQPDCQFVDTDNDNMNDSMVPFATKFHDGKLYVGSICTELGTSGAFQEQNFPVYVHTFDPDSHAWQQVFTSGIQRQTTTLGTDFHTSTWLRWLPGGPIDSWEDQKKPLLTDIEFDGNDMILGIRDMYADMVGNARGNIDPNAPGAMSVVPSGDLLRACFDDASNTWIMENNGSCGGVTTAGAFDAETSTASVGGGIGGGEYYYQDNRVNTRHHDELTTGAIAQIPGFSNLAVTVVDPGSLFSQGVGWFENADGTRNRSFEIIPNSEGDAGLGKANGLGDLEALCEQAPVEVGNYVWKDANGDGIQDPDEAGIDGINVVLTCGIDTQTAVTTNGGYYTFTNAAVVANGATQASFMDYGEDCSLSIDLSQADLTDLSLTTADTDNQTDNNALTDLRDSDASLATDNLAEIAFITGMAGENNHTLDFGFKACDHGPKNLAEVGNRIWNDADDDGLQGFDERGIDGVSVILTCGTDSQEAITTSGGYYTFSGAATVADGITPAPFMDFGEDCTLSVDLSQAVLKDVLIAITDADGQTDNNASTDLRDSDAILADDDRVEITFVSGLAGESNYTLDFGFVAPHLCVIHQPIVPVDNDTTDPVVPVDNDTTDPVVPVDNDSTDPVVPDDSNTTDPVVPVDNDTTDPVVPDDGNTTDPVVPVDNDTADPVVPVDGDTTDPVVPVDNDTTDPVVPVDSNTTDPVVPDDNDTTDLVVSDDSDILVPTAPGQ